MGWTLGGGLGNRSGGTTGGRQNARRPRALRPEDAGGNPESAFWDEEKGGSEAWLASGSQRSWWRPVIG